MGHGRHAAAHLEHVKVFALRCGLASLTPAAHSGSLATHNAQEPGFMTLRRRPHILAFDVFGTVVDWHGSIMRYMAEHHPHVDADAFACAWREGYQPAM